MIKRQAFTFLLRVLVDHALTGGGGSLRALKLGVVRNDMVSMNLSSQIRSNFSHTVNFRSNAVHFSQLCFFAVFLSAI